MGKMFPHITKNCTITKENFKFLCEMLKVKEMCGADHLTFQHPVFFNKESEMIEGIDIDKIQKELFEILKKERNVTLYAYVSKKYWFKYYHRNLEELGKGCGWNWVGLRIHPNGE